MKKVFRESLRHATTLLFIGGFIFDLLVLPEAGHLATIWIGLAYLSIVGVALVCREMLIARNRATKREQKWFSILTFGIAYFSGSSLSFICVYALRSAAFSVSWPLLLILFMCVLVNELVSSHQFRFTLDVAVLFIALLFFVIFNVPVMVKVQNDTTFVVSLCVSIAVMLLYSHLLTYTSESAQHEESRLYALSFGIPMFIGMLYFLNVIPAVPLSLASGGVYYEVHKEGSTFVGSKGRDDRMFASWRTPLFIKTSRDGDVYFFSAVSAPALLTAPLSHVWELYDQTSHRWVEKSVIEFTLAGGREEGYRAYSKKTLPENGLWRVTVKVDDKRIIGRKKFFVTEGHAVSLLEQKL